MTPRDYACVSTPVLRIRQMRLTTQRRKAEYVSRESDRLSVEAQIELAQLRKMLREDDAAMTAELDLRAAMVRPMAAD